MDLNWNKQYQEAAKALRQTVNRMRTMPLTAAQKMRSLKTCVRRTVAYPMCLAPYTKMQIHGLDAQIARATKEAYGLTRNVGTAFVMQDIRKGGLGSPSLLTEYATTQVQSLIRMCNDQTRNGVIGRELMKTQMKAIHDTAHAGYMYTQAMRLRQLKTLNDSDLCVMKEDTQQYAADLQPQLYRQVSNFMQRVWGENAVPGRVDKAIVTLARAGLTDIRQLLDKDTNTMLPCGSLKGWLGKKADTNANRRAYDLLTSYMNNLPEDEYA
jgi:hypothetical protein